MEGLRGFFRLFHWGPLIAIGIIKCITLVSLYMNAMWWPPNASIGGFVHQTIFLLLSALTAFNFVMSSLSGPRYLPLGWKPKNKNDEEFLQYCHVCEGFKAPRSHHCRKCGRCVIKMDHHCPWINNCVGWGNHAYFTYFLGFAVLGCIQAAVILTISSYRGIHRQWYLYYGYRQFATVQLTLWTLILCIFSLGLALGVIFAVGMLFYFQCRAIIRNRTGIEDWILEKARYRRNKTDQYQYPYDLGYTRNIQQVVTLTCEPIGNGIVWEVAEGCDQFTFTKEQIAQKAEKRARSKLYRVVKCASGSWIPLWSHGWRTVINPPCTDEPRIKLNIGDIVTVTRWRKYWLFGEKVDIHETVPQNTEVVKNRIRGWFPRACADDFDEEICDEKEELVEPLDSNTNNKKRS